MLSELQDVYMRDRKSVGHTMMPKLEGLDLKA